MRGPVKKQATMLSIIGPAQRVPNGHPIRRIKALADEELRKRSPVFDSQRGCQRTRAERVSKNSSDATRHDTRREGVEPAEVSAEVSDDSEETRCRNEFFDTIPGGGIPSLVSWLESRVVG